MAALIPVTQPTNVEAAYEDMFKEITRKLYGEETGNGLHTLGTPVAHVATSGPTVPEGERSFTTLMSDRSMAPSIEYDHNGGTENASNNFKTEDHLTTAFGLAALMHNGFSTGGNILSNQQIQKSSANITVPSSVAPNSTVASNGTPTNVNSSTNDGRWNPPSQDIISWSSSGKLASFNGNQKTAKSTKSKDQSNEVFHDTSHGTTQTTSSSRKNKNNNNQTSVSNTEQIPKRYNCPHCPYSTDRRDLFTRHENIHKDEKPFQCYACLKQFNRADHVKKHFLRMHRELSYDINKTRRSVTTEQKPNIFAQNSNNNQHTANESFINSQRRSVAQDISQSIAQTIESVATAQISQHSIPMKQEKDAEDKLVTKVKREKRFSCCYCPWSGADKWGLKRHLNTHTKPFVCMLCDYKAARSERLATHVLKVHNKKACNKCSYLADNQEQYQSHLNEVHPHDQRPPRNNNSNVLRTIGNTLVTNNQLSFQNPNTSFGNIQSSNSGVAIYTTHDVSTNNTNNNNTNGMQEIVVNPTSMVAWRLSASGSLIPPSITEPPNNTNGNSTLKRGAERLFQYLEADGSDPEDYARQLKMEAISRNTASVAQDFHNAGGVEKHKKNNVYKVSQAEMERHLLTTAGSIYTNTINISLLKKKAMSLNSMEDPDQMKFDFESPPAFMNLRKVSSSRGHRLDLIHQDKENSNTFISNFDTRFNKIGFQFNNYVKEIISKLYVDIYTPDYSDHKTQEKDKDVNSYLDYLQQKGDITLTVFDGAKEAVCNRNISTCVSILGKRPRKQAKPKKITQRNIIPLLRNKYMKRLAYKRKSCILCTNKGRTAIFPYHTTTSLLLHHLWRHTPKSTKCRFCSKTFSKDYSLKVHFETKHRTNVHG